MASGRPQQTPWVLGALTSRPHPSQVGKWQARGRYRDADGRRFDITASGDTEAKSKRALQAKVEDHRTTHRGGDATLNQDTTVARAAALWLESAKRKRVRGKPLAPRTLEQYEGNVRRYIEGSGIGDAQTRRGQQRQRDRAVARPHRRRTRQRSRAGSTEGAGQHPRPRRAAGCPRSERDEPRPDAERQRRNARGSQVRRSRLRPGLRQAALGHQARLHRGRGATPVQRGRDLRRRRHLGPAAIPVRHRRAHPRGARGGLVGRRRPHRSERFGCAAPRPEQPTGP